MTKLKFLPVAAFGLVTMLTSPSHAIFGFLADAFNSGCTWNAKDPVESAIMMHERLSTPLPKGLNRKVVPFNESDFRTKPWVRAYEYVIVINNQSPYKHFTELPATMPLIANSLKEFGIIDVTKSNSFNSVNDSLTSEQSASNAAHFVSQFSQEAKKVSNFGEIIYERNARGEMVPKKSNLPDVQTVRIYRNGQLIRKAKISTGRGSFQLRGRKAHCEQPVESYHTYTEPGYFNFQELRKDYKSKSYDADMPNAMFYNVGRGLALHAALAVKIPYLGTPHSGGCTRLDPETAETLYESILATENSTIPVIDILGNPVLDAHGQMTYKRSETVIYAEGTSREKRIETHRSYSALLIIQSEPVNDANPEYDRAYTHVYRAQ
jgi:hypothetical protein